MAYDPNKNYVFTDKDGNTFTSRGDNGYVWQSITEGIPISVDANGNWYTEPYLDVEPEGYVAHIPDWFKATKEYNDWQTYASQIPNLSINKTVYNNLNNILKQLGSQGALRTSLTKDIKSYGVTNQELIDKYVKNIVSMATEGKGGDKAKITLFGTEYNSAADLARHYKDLSKESLSKAMTSMYDIMEKGQKGEWTDKEEYLADAVTAAKILNYIDDNHISFGENDEFNGLLSSSVWQQINRGLTQFMGGVTSNTYVGIIPRLAYGAMNAATGNGFSTRIEDLYNERLATGADLGAGLEGNEAADTIGMWGGAIGSIAVTMATSMRMGSAINGKVASSAPGGFLNKVGTFAQTVPGSAVSDFFLNDVPLDLMMFATDTMRDGAGKAWFDPKNPQPLFGVPFIRQASDGNFYPSGVGPDVPGGLAMNLVGDAVLDAAIPFLGLVGGAVYKNLDNMTGGAVTRVREKAALSNLKVQEKISNMPLVGTAWQKFVNYMMGPENARFVMEARKAAIAEGSMEPYVRAQNLLTLSNHSGMEVVQPLYKQIDAELGISKTLKDFSKKANTYGGVGETRVEWKEIKDGRTKNFYKVVPDTIPKQVKQGLLDVERLAELKGEIENEGGVIPNPARSKEIAEIEARLENTPQEIKDFAEKFSELNKRVEAMGVELGLTTQDWIDALQADPRWESYMTRQALTIGNQTISSGTNPPDARILTAKRKGYYSENYIDPTLALGMKVEALGRAFAWNERAKAMVGFEISQGKVIAGKAGVDVAARLAEVKQEIKNSIEYRKSIGYDESLKRVNKDVTSVADAFKKVNGLLQLPEKLSLESVYEATQNPAIKEFISDFNNGKIKFAEGVKEAAGLSDSEAATIIQNTYVQKGGEARAASETVAEIKTFDEELTDAVEIGDGTRKVSWTQEEWDAWYQIDRTLSNMESFELAAKGSHAGILDLRKKLEEAARGQKYKGQPYVAALKQQAIDGLKELGVPTHLIEKIEVPYRLADANIPDTATSPVRAKLEEKAATAGYSAGVTSEGIPYKYTVENGEITSFERLESSEDYAMATSMLGGVYSMSAATVDRIGKINAAAINRTILYYRDNMPNIGTGPTFFFDGHSGSWGYIWPALVVPQYGWHLENGKIVAEQYPVFLGHSYRAGNEDVALRKKQAECEAGEKPKNTGTLESTPTHESGHSLMMQLAVHRLNRMAEEGLVKLPEDAYEIGQMVEDAYDELHALLIDRAMKKLGYENYTEADISRQASTISEYASSTNYGKDKAGRWKHDEIFSEAQRMYQGNGDNSSPFCLAIIEGMKAESERFTTAAAPGEVFAKNNLTAPKGLFKDGQYAFPAKAKTAKQKAKWLDGFRQNNPYIKGKGLLTEENYQMANLWDTFFQKEIRAYDPNSKSSMPNLLAKKNGDFIEDLSKNAAKKMVEEIKKASVEGFSQDLATMVLSRNSDDVASAMDSFIIGRVNKAAEEVAAKMPGGATEENINTARMTMWSEDNIKNDFITMLSALSPDIDGKDITSKINELFDTQAKGYASFEALPIDTKKLIGEQERLTEKLYKENNYARKKGREVDQGLTGYRGEVTQVVHYKEGGEDVYVVVNDPVIAEVLKKPSNYKETGITVEAIASAANFISRSYRIGTTGANPIAFVRNILRDPLQATIQGGFNPLNMSLSPEVFYHTLRGFGLDDATINNVTQRLRTWASSSTLTSEMRNMGIDTPATLGYRNRVEKISKQVRNPNSKLNKVIERAEAPLETWETMFRNQIAQQSFIKNYQRTKDVNRAMGAALFDASNSTTNFSHSVGMFSRATSTIPYLSSAINGTRSFWVQFNADPIGMITRITAGFMVPAMAITAWNLSSQERREAYMNLPEWYKSGHLVLIDLEGNVIAFPIPEELGQYYNTTRKLVEFTQEATPYGLGQIMSQGAFGFLPVDMDGFYGEDGSIQVGRGVAQLVNGILPQAATAIYEFAAEKDLFTGQDLSDYNAFQKWINLGTNILGTGFKNVVNDIGYLVGAPSEFRLGKTTADTLARDLFGVGFDNVKSEFMNLVGDPSEVDPETGKETAATGLFAENEKLQQQIEKINAQIAYSSEDKKAELENQKQTLITNFTERVSNLVNKYMNLYSQTGGLEEWQKEKIVKLLTLGRSSSSADSSSYQSADASTSYLNERALAQQRYVGAGLPAGPSLEALGDNGSIALQAAINRFYGVNKQATQDFKNVVEDSGMKGVKDEFYAVMQQIYDAADEQGLEPDYELIERIQARYLQMMDSALIPIISEYGIGVLNNNDFIDAVRRQVNGMIPSDDWRQSVRNAKKFLSTKDFPTATVDVKKWLKQRYTSGMRNRNLASDPEVTERIESIKADIDAGRMGAAAGKIEDLKTGINKANFYISSEDFMILNQLNNMLK